MTDEFAPVSAGDDEANNGENQPVYTAEDGEIPVDEVSNYTPESSTYVEPPPQTVSLWQQLKNLFFPDPFTRREETERRMRDLDRAIEFYPETPSNYLYRGEMLLEMGQPEEAAADFNIALELAAAQVEQDDWGLVAQVVQDRAQIGLERAAQALHKRL